MHWSLKNGNDLTTEKGFTLVELLVGMLLLGIAMTAIYSSYFSQQKVYVVQAQVAAMQQNLRTAMYLMTSDIRMAGYDRINTGNFGLVSAMAGGGTCNATNIALTIDDNNDGNLDNLSDAEMIAYRLNGTTLQKYGGASGWQDIARNIDALNFIYLDTNRVETADLTSVRFIEVTVLAQTDRGDKDYTDNNLYRNQQNDLLLPAAPGDNLRRKLLTSFIKCRNLGL
jgi:type IV pilus assembly protein PilW